MRQTKEWQDSLTSEDFEESKQRLFPKLPDSPIPRALAVSSYAGIYKHPTEATIDLSIVSGSLAADLGNRIIPCELSLIHASGEFFIGRIRNEGLDLWPPFPVESQLNFADFLLEPDMKDEKVWFEHCGS